MTSSKSVALRLPPEVYERVRAGAASAGVNVSVYLRIVIERGLDVAPMAMPKAQDLGSASIPSADNIARRVLEPILERLIFVQSVSEKISTGDPEFEARALERARELARQELSRFDSGAQAERREVA